MTTHDRAGSSEIAGIVETGRGRAIAVPGYVDCC